MTYSNANFTPGLKGYSDIKPFRFWCQKVLPLVYDDSLSYYELLCKVVDYINNIIDDLSATEDNVASLLDAYNQLQDYVNNYFTNLDVQEEINNKLDSLVEDGTLTELIGNYIDPRIAEIQEELDNYEDEMTTNFNGLQSATESNLQQQNDKIFVLEGRMDTFSQLTSGSTTGDAELADIRVAFDGTTYPNAGDAVRESDTIINYKTDTLVDSLLNNVMGNNYTLYSGGINTTGNSTTSGTRCRTGYINLRNGKGFKLFLNSNDYKIINVHLYQNANDTSSLRVITVKTNKIAIFSRNENENYLRVSFAHTTDTESISTSDINTIKPLFSVNILTDTTLSLYDIPADAKTVGDKFNNVNNNFIHTNDTQFTWEVGSIGSTTGDNSASTTRIRSVGYYEVNSGGYVMSTNSGYKYATRFYDSSQNFIAEYSTYFNDETKTISLKDKPLAKYFRLVVARNDDSTISSDDVETVASNLTVMLSNTDVTLSRLGFAADASVVGKYLNRSIKILGIGNSYTRDSLRWVWKILKELGYNDVIVGHGYIGGITLEEQYDSIIDSSSEYHSAYQYWKYTDSQTATKTNDQTLADIITDENWDVVIFQQQSDEAGQYDSFVSNTFDINNFVTYLKTNIANNNLRIGLALTWSHATGYAGENFIEWYDGDPTVQLNAIKTVIPQVANHMTQCDFIVNSGIAVDYGRNNTYLNALGVEMLRSDKNHLYYGIPSFMISLLYVITALDINPTSLAWYPTATDEGQAGITVSAFLAYLGKQCAVKAKEYI